MQIDRQAAAIKLGFSREHKGAHLMLTSTLQDFIAKPTTLKLRAYRAGGVTIVGHFASVALRLAGTIVLTRLFRQIYLEFWLLSPPSRY